MNKMILKVFSDTFILHFKDQSIRIDISFFSTILCLLPIFLITGPAIPDIAVSILALYFLITSIKRKLWLYYKSLFIFFFSVFCIYLILCSIFSDFPLLSITTSGSVFYFRYLFFTLCVCYLIDENKYLNIAFRNVIIFCTLALIFDGVYQYIFDFNIIGFPKFSPFRLTSFFGDEPILGRYLSFFVIFGFILLIKTENKKFYSLFIIYLMLGAGVTFLSGERNAFFIIFIFILFHFILRYRFSKKIIFIISLLTFILLLLFNLLTPTAYNRIIDQTIEQLNQQKQLKFLLISKHHEEIYLTSLNIYKHHKIFGVGTALFRHTCQDEKYLVTERACLNHPHNYYIQLLSENGIVGFSFFLSFYLYLIFNFSKIILERYRKYNNSNCTPSENVTIYYIILLLLMLMPIISHMDFYNNWYNPFIFLALGFFLKKNYHILK